MIMRTDSITNCQTILVQKARPKLSFFLTSLCCLIVLMSSNQSFAQKTPPPPPNSPADCKLGCTSNDVRILSAYLVDPVTEEKLDASFQCQGTATVKLALELATNTPRVGVVVYANIKQFSNGAPVGNPLATPSECFGVALNQPSNKVVFQNTFGWTCGTPIVLTNVFLGWGTGNTNFCTSDKFQCPGTSSKCYSLPDGQYITIQIPTGQNASQIKCSTDPEGNTATFNLTESDNTVKNGQSNVTVRWYSDAAGANELTGTNKTAFVNTTNPHTVYAKVCNDANLNVCSALQPVTLTVNPTPAAPVLSKVDNCDGTTTITAKDGQGNTIAGSQLSWTGTSQTGNPIIVSTTAAITATRTVNTCPSAASTSVTPAPKGKPNTPALSKVDNCDGTTTITAKDGNTIIDGTQLSWSGTNQTGNPIYVNTTVAITATWTVNGCSSDASSSIIPAPKSTPAAPVLSKTDNCDGTTTITAKDGNGTTIPASQLTWSNGATTNPISVTTTTAVTATRTIDGCSSDASNSITPAPKSTPARPNVTITEATLCGTLAAPKLTVNSPIVGATYTLTQASGGTTFQPVVYSSGILEFTGLVPGKGFSISVSQSGCPSAEATNCNTSINNDNSRGQANMTNIIAEIPFENKTSVIAAPNPFSDRIRFMLKSGVSGQGSLELYNTLGQKVKTVFQGYVNANQLQTIEYAVPNSQRSNLIYVFRVGNEQTSGKLIGLK
jgi:hypothetical protein